MSSFAETSKSVIPNLGIDVKLLFKSTFVTSVSFVVSLLAKTSHIVRLDRRGSDVS